MFHSEGIGSQVEMMRDRLISSANQVDEYALLQLTYFSTSHSSLRSLSGTSIL